MNECTLNTMYNTLHNMHWITLPISFSLHTAMEQRQKIPYLKDTFRKFLFNSSFSIQISLLMILNIQGNFRKLVFGQSLWMFPFAWIFFLFFVWQAHVEFGKECSESFWSKQSTC